MIIIFVILIIINVVTVIFLTVIAIIISSFSILLIFIVLFFMILFDIFVLTEYFLNFNPIQEGGGRVQKATQELAPNFLTFSFDPFATLV